MEQPPFTEFTSPINTVYNFRLDYHLAKYKASLVAQMANNDPAMPETGFNPWVEKIPLEEGLATHSSILAWRIPMDRGAWWVTVHGVGKSQT